MVYLTTDHGLRTSRFTEGPVYVIVFSMSLEERIDQDFITARKNKDTVRSHFLGFIRAEMKNYAIDVKKEHLDDNEVLAILKKQKKRLSEAEKTIASSSRQDMIEELKKELAVLDQYLPAELSDEELTGIVTEVISFLGATSAKDMGRVMKEVMAKTAGAADGKKVSELVRSRLTA
ncbi:MAG: GatB/YqeY domain-containing protein, partial [Candidatus Omnitrophica bacterium]|nr:GatB/YqeY domain-containing protein [Candidatus Omnitrophota bacterium]